VNPQMMAPLWLWLWLCAATVQSHTPLDQDQHIYAEQLPSEALPSTLSEGRSDSNKSPDDNKPPPVLVMTQRDKETPSVARGGESSQEKGYFWKTAWQDGRIVTVLSIRDKISEIRSANKENKLSPVSETEEDLRQLVEGDPAETGVASEGRPRVRVRHRRKSELSGETGRASRGRSKKRRKSELSEVGKENRPSRDGSKKRGKSLKASEARKARREKTRKRRERRRLRRRERRKKKKQNRIKLVQNNVKTSENVTSAVGKPSRRGKNKKSRERRRQKNASRKKKRKKRRNKKKKLRKEHKQPHNNSTLPSVSNQETTLHGADACQYRDLQACARRLDGATQSTVCERRELLLSCVQQQRRAACRHNATATGDLPTLRRRVRAAVLANASCIVAEAIVG